MTILSGKHLFGEINGTRVSFIEKKIEQERLDFLKELLEVNGFEVILEELRRRKEEDPQLYNIGVTDMVFNPTIWIFERKLKTIDGKYIVNQDYWKQVETDNKPQYWKNN